MTEKFKPPAYTKAIIYCRVSSKKQATDGSGLVSQEHRCREYAAQKGYQVQTVFLDDMTGGGDFMKRPGMVGLLRYIDGKPHENFVVIFDDLKRFARDTQFHIKLRQEFLARGAKVECLNFNFEDTPEGRFVETIFAAQGELEREQNRRQVIQKMKARVENGFWVFRAPVGYSFVNGSGGGKILEIKEPEASAVREALEGFASRRFSSQTELRRFLEQHPHFPSDLPNGGIRPQTIVRLLRKVVYAGYVSAPKWGVSIREGHHEGLISFSTYEKNQKRLDEGVYASTRKDIKEDFPLRGAVSCCSCDTPLTAGWSKGKTKTYPYYFCRSKGCERYGKSIPRKKIEGDFSALLEQINPTTTMTKLVTAMFKDIWDQRASQAKEMAKALGDQIKEAEKSISELIELVVGARNPRVVSAYEKKIEELEMQKLGLTEKQRDFGQPLYTFEQMFELSMKFLSSPCFLWKSGKLELQRTVLRLTFSEGLAYCRETGFRTPKTTLPFKVLGDINRSGCEMVL